MKLIRLTNLSWLCALLICALSAHAGKNCSAKTMAPAQVRAAAQAALRLTTVLDEAITELPERSVALVARIGQDFSDQGLLYSHVGIVFRHADSWRVLHLLNECSSDRGGIFEEGLLNFFSDDLLSFQSKVVWLNPELAAQVQTALDSHSGKQILQARYSVIAEVFSSKRQNSTAWVLELLAAASNPLPDSRMEAHTVLKSQNYQSDTIKIPYGKRVLGGLFSANADFAEHPLGDRLSGRYQVTTVKSIFRHARANGWVAQEQIVAEPNTNLRPGD
jgi:hypothetical protein